MKKVAKWDPELNIGAGLIDNQHKIIFDLINDLGRASEAKADKKVIDTLLDVIENYVFRHFEAEEELFGNHKDSQAHCLEHYGLIKEFRKFRLSFRNRNSSEDTTSAFLEQWFLAHIKNSDIPLFASIANGGETQTEIRVIDEYPFETTERRRHKRIQRKKITNNEIVADCYSTANLKYTSAVLIDLSLGGLRLRSSQSYIIGDLLVVTCKIGKNFKLNEKVRIVNREENCYGAEFIHLSPATEKFLMELYGSINIKNF
jgi:hemerythrin-like metal-binding protein